MFFSKIVFAVFTCATVTNRLFVDCQDDKEPDPETQEEEEKQPSVLEDHTFVALLDIFFSDGFKKTCSGSIIHENVVITAAHCFSGQPELSASFVVVGTKKMYDTGYENYLPIERIIKHPKFKGWTADIALVYTFAGMTSDKPGNIIPLVGENSLTPVDSNVTILSWGRCKDQKPRPQHTTAPLATGSKPICDSGYESSEDGINVSYKPLLKDVDSSDPNSEPEKSTKKHKSPRKIYERQRSNELQSRSGQQKYTTPRNFNRGRTISSHNYSTSPTKPTEQAMKIASRYLMPSETTEKSKERGKGRKREKHSSEGIIYQYSTQKHRYKKAKRNEYHSEDFMNEESIKRKGKFSVTRTNARRSLSDDDIFGGVTEQKTPIEIETYFNNSRRRQGYNNEKKKHLTVETFGFVNVQTCKRIVDKAMPSLYSINTNDVVCYAAEEHYISDDDSGAPAIRQGHLVAVTLGGVECEGEHVAIGIKMSCFCSWIVENLPPGDTKIKCCKDCCSGGDQTKRGHSSKNRYV